MGTPATEGSMQDALNDLGGRVVAADIRKNFHPKQTNILDVGAGWGKYRKLLPEYSMDAVEIWEPYIKQEKLDKMYDKVFNMDICDLMDIDYDVIILGDVLEHIERERAVPLIERLKNSCTQLYAVIPYLYRQGEVHGNKYEIHLQDDLTHSMIEEIYKIRLLSGDDHKGVYIK